MRRDTKKAGPPKRAPPCDDPGTGELLQGIRFRHRRLAAALDHEYDTTILLRARVITLGANHHLTRLAIADRVDQLRAHASRREVRAHGLGTTHRQRAIVRVGP